MKEKLCPVCGYDLGFKPWNGDSPSDEICPSCGIQFGYDDHVGGGKELRQAFYLGWRGKWRVDGMRWWSKTEPPKDWNPQKQLKSLLE